MSYDIELRCPVTNDPLTIDFKHKITGGTYQVGGTNRLWLNITYNYCSIFKRIFGDDGIRTIYGMNGAESIPLLKKGIDELANDVSENYWEATEGNAKLALMQLVALAQLRPDGVWHGD